MFLFLSVFMIVSCKENKTKSSEQNEKQNSIIVGFSQIGAESAWRTCNTESMKKAAREAGIQLLYENAEQKQENQIKALRSFIAYQVDVIVFVPIVQKGWDNVLREAKEAGIPVILSDRKIQTSDETLYAGLISTNSEQQGRNAAKYLVEKFEGRKKVNIVEIRGTDGSSVVEGRYNGFREIISQHPEFEIVASETGDFLRSKGKEAMQLLIEECKEKNIKIDAIYSHNDGMILGAFDTLRKHNMEPGKDVVIVSIDAEQAAIDALKEGLINCVIECNPDTGALIIEIVKNLVAGNQIPRVTYVSETVFPDYSDLSKIEPRGY
ncbi:MAG: substrate-binding domain-containing protein [Treponema sp.]|nr:substrate-binding domain-containing protein [Treponema sp.]